MVVCGLPTNSFGDSCMCAVLIVSHGVGSPCLLHCRSEVRRWSLVSQSSGYTTGLTDSPASLSVCPSYVAAQNHYVVEEMKLYSHSLASPLPSSLCLCLCLCLSPSLLQSYPSQEHIHHQVGSLNESLTSEDLCTIVGTL